MDIHNSIHYMYPQPPRIMDIHNMCNYTIYWNVSIYNWIMDYAYTIGYGYILDSIIDR